MGPQPCTGSPGGSAATSRIGNNLMGDRMITGGEDALYIARRLVVVASEDVGLADNHALPLVSLDSLVSRVS
jgi:hypothetical protein